MKKIDYSLLIAILILSIFGVIMIYSASNVWALYKFNDAFKFVKQSIAFLKRCKGTHLFYFHKGKIERISNYLGLINRSDNWSNRTGRGFLMIDHRPAGFIPIHAIQQHLPMLIQMLQLKGMIEHPGLTCIVQQ